MIDPDDLLDELQDREENPASDRARGITNDIKDEAIGRAKDRAKDAGKDAVKKAGKEAIKQGGKAGAQAAGEGAAAAGAGAAAGGGSAAATGATVAATTGVETAGIGAIVGAAIAVLGNKKLRNITIGGLGMILLLFMGITIMTILTPIIIVSSVASEAYDLIEPIVENRAVQFGIKAGTTVVKTQYKILKEGGEVVAGGVDLAGNAADAVIPGDGAPCVKTRWGSVGCGYDDTIPEPVAATDDALGEVLAATDGGATAEDPNSRLAKLAQAMSDQGFFMKLISDYGVNIQTRDGETFDIVLNDIVIKKNLTEEQVQREFMRNKVLRAIMQSVNEQVLHVFDYSKRVTLAEKGMSQYQTQQLFIPGADTAREDADVAKVKQESLEVQNNPFISSMKTDLQCTVASCTDWVPDTSAGDQVEMTQSISRESNFDSVGSLYSRMRDRIKENGKSDDPNFIDWYHYVKEMHEKAKYSDEQALNDPFIKGSLDVRKSQATRLWFHQQTLVDQFKANQLTDSSASALFHSFIGGSNSKAYKYLSGQPGGVGFRNYDKINDNTPNVVKTVYRDWQEENPEKAKIVTDVVESRFYRLLDSIGLDGLLDKILGSNDARAKALESAFQAGSKIMLPACDASRAGPSFVNCLYAGAENTARDVGMTDYGSSGKYSKEDQDELLAYSTAVDQQVAQSKSIFERMANTNGKDSFVNKLVLQAAVPVGSHKDFASLSSYFMQLPSQIARLAITPFSGQVLAAEDEQTINNIDRSGIKLESLKNTPLSTTLDNSSGDVSSCPITTEEQENLCRADETTYLALAAKFGLLDDGTGDFPFTVGSYNILNAESWPGPSKDIGGCSTAPVAGDPDCSKTRSQRQAQIITGQAGNPQMDIVGLQEVSPKQFNQLKDLLPNYSAIPSNGSRMTNSKDGAVAIMWNNAKFTKFTQGKAAGISNTAKDITNPWVGLQTPAGQKVYVMSIHYPNDNYGGDPSTIRRASRLTMDWVKSKVKDDTLVVVVGDFNDELGQRLHYCIYTEDGLLQHAHDMEQGDSPNAGCASPDTSGIDHIYASPTMGVTASGWTQMPRTGIVASASDHEPVHTTLTFPAIEGAGTDFVISTYNQPVRAGEDGWQKFINNIREKGADVVGTQEMARQRYIWLREKLTSGGEYAVFPDRTANEMNVNCSHETSIIYKTAKFEFIKAEYMSFPREEAPPQTCGDGERTSRDMANAPIVWLKDKGTGQVIIAMNTHNAASGYVPNADKVRWEAAKIYVETVNRLKLQNPGIPIFFTGDFNEGTGVRYPPRNATYQGKVENLLFCMFAQNKLMRSAGGPEMRCGGYGIGIVDYIYITDEVQVKSFSTIPGGLRGPSGSDHPAHFAHVVVPATGGGDASLRVATFNILHVGDSPFEQQWRTRLPKSITTLKSNSIKVAGLQEVRPQQHDLLTSESYAKDTYDIFPKSSKNPEFSPNPVIWDKSLFTLVSGRTLPIEYDSGSKIDHAVQVLLRDKSGNEFYVLNTHDPANARPGSDQQNALSRLNNARFYTRHLAELSRQGKPIFLTGDFNSSYTMGGGQKPYNNLAENLTYCVISRGGVMKNVWDIFQKKQFHCPRSSVPENAPIDHIYVANDAGVSKVWVAKDRTNGSDHPTVMAEVKMPWATQDNGGGTGGGTGKWRFPVAESAWRSDGQRWLEGHTTISDAWTNSIKAAADVNIGSGDSDCGKPVYSMIDGTVVSNPPGYTMQVRSTINGKSVLITYAHGNNAKQGGSVKAGDQIMTIGKQSRYSGMTCHLHLEISYNGRPVCPQDVFPLIARNQSPDLASLATRSRYACN